MRRQWIVGTKTKSVEMKRKVLTKEDAPIANEVNKCEHISFFVKKTEKVNDFLRNATVMHKLLAEGLWQYKIWNKLGIPYTNDDNDIDVIK